MKKDAKPVYNDTLCVKKKKGYKKTFKQIIFIRTHRKCSERIHTNESRLGKGTHGWKMDRGDLVISVMSEFFIRIYIHVLLV